MRNIDPDKPARALVFFVVVAIALTTISRSGAYPDIDTSISDAVIAGLPLVGFIISLPRLLRRRVSGVGVWIAVSFAIAVTLAGLVNGPGLASVFGMLLPAMMAVVLVLVGNLVNAVEFRIIARWVVALAVLQVIIAIAEVQLLEDWARDAATVGDLYPFRPNLLVDGIGRANGTMGHPILLGLICTIGAVLVLSGDIVKKPIFRVALVAFLIWGVILSGSRSSLAAFAVAVLLFFIHPASPAKRWARVLMVITITPLTLLYVAEAVSTAREVSMFSLTNRIDAIPRLWETLNRPFPYWFVGEGTGFKLDTVADNQFLTASGAYGLIGLISLVVAIVYAFRSKNPIAVSAVGCLAFMALSFDTLTWAFSTFLFWFVVGHSHAKTSADTNDEKPLPDQTIEVQPRRGRAVPAGR